jgi:hypothetical protein
MDGSDEVDEKDTGALEFDRLEDLGDTFAFW